MTRAVAVASSVLIVGFGLVAWSVSNGAQPAVVTQETPQLTAFQAPIITDTASLDGPRQPVFFRHDIHAGQFEMPCQYCHTTVSVSWEPGIPSMETCVGCHQFVRGSTPEHQAEIKKVNDAWAAQEPVEWVRIHSLPDFVQFPHMRHIKALGPDACLNCHGDIAEMVQVAQQQTLRMGWCVDCHKTNDVTIDCTSCHY